jgi:hypothetical protein
MTAFALPLIVLSAVMHASWNLLAKRAKTSGASLVWLFAFFETLLFLPFVVMLLNQLRPGDSTWIAAGVMVGAGCLPTIYFWLGCAGYRVGAISGV